MTRFLRRIPELFQPAERGPTDTPARAPQVELPAVEIAPNDPIVAYFLGADGPVDIQTLGLDSPAAKAGI